MRGTTKLKIKIEKVSAIGGNYRVDFLTEYGISTANWDGDLPEEGKEYFIEIEIGEVLTLGKNLKVSDKGKFTIGMEGDFVTLIGCIESIEEDGYTVLRLGDSIISLEVLGVIPLDSFVKVISNEVTLFDVKY